MNIIDVKNLSFSYGKQDILRNICLQVPENSIYGFLGANGAGKSTTIRVLMGLISAPENTVYFFGKEFTRHRVELLGKVGALIDFPTFYDHLSAWANLKVITKLLGIKDNAINHALEKVGLDSVYDKKVRTFSVGMKQRLGLAIALINNPTVLILDEPASGLDPLGIIELRKLLTDLQQDHGKTIFVSSHILDELEKIATHLAIIHKGHIRFQGTTHELVSKTGSLEKSFLTMTL
ncbi:MAG TPA: ATP-binding cassette domain-containing protein [Chitinophagaceae bacterium]|nr:ATP-binding cassette domain-containing protein [Chitinophagaceae bacterium]